MNRRRRGATNARRTLLALLLGVSAAGCTAPPAVTPLLRATAAALEAEAQHIETDRQRVAASSDQARAALDAAFAADLDLHDAPDRSWLLEAAQVYAAAREAVALHEHRAHAAFDARQDNLRRAAEAQQRAIALIEQQDRLIVETTGVDLWAWVGGGDAVTR